MQIHLNHLLRRIMLIMLLLSTLAAAQYYGYGYETVTEKSFEESDLFFTSHFLNPFGLPRYRDVSVGLFDDPFLNLQLNPANLPKFENGSSYIYLDFRGDRTEAAIVEDYVVTRASYAEPLAIYDRGYYPYIDPRWYVSTRSEPEPLFSLGILNYPLGKDRQRLLIGGSYQLVHKEEPFYSVPDLIYGYRTSVDELAASDPYVGNAVPIIDRYNGVDEMGITGHRLSGILGYRLSSRIDLGVFANGLIHSRDGQYGESRIDDYGYYTPNESHYVNATGRTQDYDHVDLSGGIRFHLSGKVSAGVKGGFLSGRADQDYEAGNSYLSQYGQPGVDPNWSYARSRSLTDQNWRHKGDTRYGRIHLTAQASPVTRINAYYRFEQSDVDVRNFSLVDDSSSHRYHWEDISDVYDGEYGYSFYDRRSGSGTRKRTVHQAMANFEWQLNERNTLRGGLYYANNQSDINTVEPVSARRFSQYSSTSNNENYNDLFRLVEEKELHWQYAAHYWTVQIPVFTHFQFNEHWGLMVGVNRILKSWEIDEETLALFDLRQKTDLNGTETEQNFGERYTQPTRSFTEEFTDVIANIEVALTPRFRINLLLDPDFRNDFRVAQWWLGFRTSL